MRLDDDSRFTGYRIGFTVLGIVVNFVWLHLRVKVEVEVRVSLTRGGRGANFRKTRNSDLSLRLMKLDEGETSLE